MPRAPHLRLTLLVALLGATSCDCADRVRRLVDRQAPPRIPLPDADQGAPPPASSDPVELEPNDSPDQSTPITMTAELRPIRASLSSAADVDWYTLSGPAQPGPWLVEITALGEQRGLALALELESGGQPPVKLTYKAQDAARGARAPLVGLGERGPLRVGVRSLGGQGDYTIRFVRSLGAAAREAEPNDTREAAWPLPAPGQLQGALDRAHDRDVFRLEGGQGKLYALRFDARLVCEATLELVGEDGALVWAALVTPEQSFEVPNLLLPAGPSWLTVAGCDAAGEQPYTLRLIEPPPAAGAIKAWEAEPNDDPLKPQELVGSSAQLGGWLHSPSDVDQLRLTLEPPAQAPQAAPGAKITAPYSLLVQLKPARPDLALALTWQPPGQPAQALTGAPGQAVELCGAPAQAGAHALVVRAAPRPDAAAPAPAPMQAGPDYTLAITAQAAQAGAAGQEVEPNDVSEQADLLLLEQSVEGMINAPEDRDRFAVELPEDAANPTRRVRFGLDEHPLNLAFTVFDDEGAPVGVADQAGARGAEQLEVDLPAGRYIVEVRAGQEASAPATRCARYKLSAAVVNP